MDGNTCINIWINDLNLKLKYNITNNHMNDSTTNHLYVPQGVILILLCNRIQNSIRKSTNNTYKYSFILHHTYSSIHFSYTFNLRMSILHHRQHLYHTSIISLSILNCRLISSLTSSFTHPANLLLHFLQYILEILSSHPTYPLHNRAISFYNLFHPLSYIDTRPPTPYHL